MVAWLSVVLEPEHFFRELHGVQGLSAVHPSGAAVSSQGLHAARKLYVGMTSSAPGLFPVALHKAKSAFLDQSIAATR